MAFNLFADAFEDNSNLGSEAIGVAQRTQNGVLGSLGINALIPSPVQNFSDGVYETNRRIVEGVGHRGATLLRQVGYHLEGAPNDGGGTVDHRGPRPSTPDVRDYTYHPADLKVETEVDLRGFCPEVYSQGHLMSCTANAVAAAYEFCVIKDNLPSFRPSRLFIWYSARATDHTVWLNKGCTLKNALSSLARSAKGVCTEEEWSYVDESASCHRGRFPQGAKAAKEPPLSVLQHARLHVAKYFVIRSDNGGIVKNCIKCLNEGHPFVFGLNTYGLLSEDNVRKTGWGLRMPTRHDKKDQHRHSLLAVGYSDRYRVFIVRNSWGENWGENGYFYLPYQFLKQEGYEFWRLSVVDTSGKH